MNLPKRGRQIAVNAHDKRHAGDPSNRTAHAAGITHGD
jgi:hypothetical protein